MYRRLAVSDADSQPTAAHAFAGAHETSNTRTLTMLAASAVPTVTPKESTSTTKKDLGRGEQNQALLAGTTQAASCSTGRSKNDG